MMRSPRRLDLVLNGCSGGCPAVVDLHEQLNRGPDLDAQEGREVVQGQLDQAAAVDLLLAEDLGIVLTLVELGDKVDHAANAPGLHISEPVVQRVHAKLVGAAVGLAAGKVEGLLQLQLLAPGSEVGMKHGEHVRADVVAGRHGTHEVAERELKGLHQLSVLQLAFALHTGEYRLLAERKGGGCKGSEHCVCLIAVATESKLNWSYWKNCPVSS